MKVPVNLKLFAKLVLLHMMLIGLVILASCGADVKVDSKSTQKSGFVLKEPEVYCRDSGRYAMESQDSQISAKWRKDCSRWYGYSAMNGGQ